MITNNLITRVTNYFNTSDYTYKIYKDRIIATLENEEYVFTNTGCKFYINDVLYATFRDYNTMLKFIDLMDVYEYSAGRLEFNGKK